MLKRIEEEWGAQWRAQFDPEGLILPSYMSEQMLASIRRVSMVRGARPATVGKAVAEIIKSRLSERSAGRRAVATATAGDCLQAEEQLTKQILGPQAVKQTIDYRADAAKQSSK